MKKLMSIMLALAMALSLCVTTTWADATTLPAADENGVITLTDNVTLSATHVVESDVTINLNGHTIDGSNCRAIHVKSGTLTLTGSGTVSSTFTGTEPSTSSAIRVGDNAATADVKIVVNAGVTVKGVNCYALTIFVTDGDQMLSADVYGKLESNNMPALGGNGSLSREMTTINVHPGAVITSESETAIFHPQKGTLTIDGATVTGATALYVKSGTVSIKNSTLTGTLTPVDYAYTGNGEKPTGDALVVDSCEYPGGAPTITIENSTLKGTKAAVGAYEYVKTSETHTSANVEVKSGSLIGGEQPGITRTVTGAEGASTDGVDPTNIAVPAGTPMATNGDDYYVGSDSIAAAANSGKEMTMVQGGAIAGLEPGATIIVPQGVTGTTLNGNAAEYGYYTIADPNAYQHEPVRRQHTTVAVEDTTTTTDTKADDTTKADTVTSAKTFDAGVAVYGMMAVLSLTGSAWVVGKKRV